MKFRTLIAMFVMVCGLRAARGAEGTASILPLSLLTIESIHLEGNEIVVTAQVSADFKRVTLESRPRLGGGNWEPISIQRLEEFSTQVKIITFRVLRSADTELLRLRGDASEPLPASFYKGTNSFGVPTTTGGAARTGAGGGGVFETAPSGNQNDAGGAPAPREVVESDIWNVEGDTLFFFNQYRGLQVVDIKQPDSPVVLGTYTLPAAGEQMYVYDPTHVILLARDQCGTWSSTGESRVILLEITNGQPKSVAELPVPGTIRESRLVGTALYVVSEGFGPIQFTDAKGTPQEVREWGSQVFSFDLSNFSSPKQKFNHRFSGYGHAIMATDRFLFVATPQNQANWWSGNSDITIFDISAADGTTQALSVVHAGGRVKDKFKMNLNGDILTAVTETWGSTLKTRVETFSLSDPKSPSALGNMLIVEREQLHATRFAGKLLYAVTFMRIDPLWIIDLSDPAKPRKVGELEIPGWSTYIHPLEGRLVTMGVDNTEGWRTAVQLFNVEDPTKPTLLKKIVLGEQYSSSEANQDEKAFGVLPDQKLILVPYTTWSQNRSFQGVHLIDLERDTLVKRGAIDHQLQSRRATVHRDRILSLSGSELLSVDATDRDHPKVVSSTELSFSADRVFLQGEHLVELATPWNEAITLRVALANDASQLLKRYSLPNLPLLGAAVKDQRLYLVQGKSTEVIWPKEWNPTNYVPLGTNQAFLSFSVYDLSKLPDVTLLGQTETKYETNKYWNTLEALWPKPGVLVWSSMQSGYFWGWGMPVGIDAAVAEGGGGGVSRVAPIDIWRPWWGGYDSYFLAYDVNQAGGPKFLSEVNLRGTNNWWNFSQPYTVDGLVYLSHQYSEFNKELQPPPFIYQKYDGTNLVSVTNVPPPGAWVQKYFLDVVNYNNPSDPSIRKPVNIPGSLIGVARGGALLFTQGYRYKDPTVWSDQQEWIDASAYDGVEAHLVDSLLLPASWPHPVLAQDSYLFLGRPVETNNPSATIETWTLSDAGKFTRLGSTPVKPAVQNFKDFGKLLIAQLDGQIELFNATNPASLRSIGSGFAGGCIGYNLKYADGALDRGLWIPLGPYGVTKLSLRP